MNPLAALRLPRFTHDEIAFSLKSFAAAMLALYVANRAGLPRPFWAMLTSYVVAHPLAGNVRSKALFRFCGTLLGCMATVAILPPLAQSPELATLALALWVGGCLCISLQDRTARSYVFMLAGYTAALIGFPSIETPPALFDNAVARVEEIGLGILCATAVHSLVLPVGLGPTVLGLLDRSLADARLWFTDVVRPAQVPDRDRAALLADRQRLAGDITQLRLLSTHVPFDTGHLRWTAGAIGAMQDHLAALTPALWAVEDRLQALAAHEGRLAPDIVGVLDAAARWLAAGERAPGGSERDAALRELRAALQSLGEPRATPATSADSAPKASWARVLRIGLATRLLQLVDGWLACEALRATIDAGLAGAAPPRLANPLDQRVLHRDVGLALRSALAAVVAICLACAF